MRLQGARQNVVIEPRDDGRGQLTGGQVDALLVTASSLADEPVGRPDYGPLDGILIAVGAGSLLWAAIAWALYTLLQ